MLLVAEPRIGIRLFIRVSLPLSDKDIVPDSQAPSNTPITTPNESVIKRHPRLEPFREHTTYHNRLIQAVPLSRPRKPLAKK